MKKKLLAILVAGVLTAGLLAGCGGSSSSSGSSDSAAQTEETEEAEATDEATEESADAGSAGGYKIALIQQHQTNAFQIAVTDGANAKAAELGVDLTILSSDQDVSKQINQIEQCVSEGYQAILFEPVDPNALGDTAQAAADKGVIMINTVSACIDWQDHGISAISCGDDVACGKLEMEKVVDLLGGKGNIAILTGPAGDSANLQRMEGYESVLAENPDIVQVVEPSDCKWDTAAAQGTVESWLSAYDLDAIVCQNDGMAVGAGNAAGANSGLIITGVDGTPDGYEAINDGRMTGTVAQDGGQIAANGIEAAVTLIDGGQLETTTIITPAVWIDASNVADYQ